MLIIWTDQEKSDISNLLDKLWGFNDKFLSEDKRKMYITEFQESNYPAQAVIAGIKSLLTKEMLQIKMAFIKNAIHGFIDRNILDGCTDCGGSGFISVVDTFNNDYSFACNCMLGRAIHDREKLPLWGRKEFQSVNNKSFTKKWSEKELTLNGVELLLIERFKKLGVEKVIEELCPW